MISRENSEIAAQAPDLTRELTSDEIEVVSGEVPNFARRDRTALSPMDRKVDWHRGLTVARAHLRTCGRPQWATSAPP
jgi:hypothetical protein